MRTPSGDAAPRVRSARTGRADPPPGPQPAPHHSAPRRLRPLHPPGAAYCSARYGRSAATAAATLGSRASDASPATSADPAARSGLEKKKGVNPEVQRPPASQWQHGGNKSGPAKEGRSSGSRTTTCGETCHFPTFPCPSPSLALAPPLFFLLHGTELPSTLLTCQIPGRERRPHRRAHPATLALARP